MKSIFYGMFKRLYALADLFPTILGLVLLTLLIASPVHSQIAQRGGISGKGIATDGDTFRLGSTIIRLVGIDAPEKGQRCSHANGKSFACGEEVSRQLQRLLDRGTTYCQRRGGDGYGRELAECWTIEGNGSATNLSEYLILNGLAFAHTKYSEEFVVLEAFAQSRKAGLWAGKFDLPWAWREKQKPATANITAPLGLLAPPTDRQCPSSAPYCKNIHSCAQACFLLSCGFARLDRDNDGIPCENVCRRRCP